MTPVDVPPVNGGSESASKFLAQFDSTFQDSGWRAASPLIEQHWDAFATTEPDVLLDAIKALPAEAFMENPAWMVGVNYLRHLATGTDPRSFRRTFGGAPDGTRSDVDLRERLIGLTGRIAEMRTAGRLQEAVAIAAEARRSLLSARSEEFALLKAALPHLTVQWARAMDLADDPGAFEIYEDTYETSLLTEQPRVARRAAASLAWMYADRGHTGEARRWLERSTAIEAQTDRYDIPLFLTAALLAADALEDREASARMKEAGQFPVGEYWAASLWVRSLIQRDAEDAVAVHNDLTRDVRRHPEGLVTAGANPRYLATTRWALGLAQVGPDTAVDPTPAAEATHGLIAAEASYRHGALADAVRRCAPLLDETTFPRTRAAALLITAASRYRLGRTGTGVDSFRRAHALIEHEGLLLTFSMIDSTDLRDLCRASHLELRPEVIRSIDERMERPRPAVAALTRRERQVLGLLASDMSNAEIAESLFITVNTLKSTLQHVYRKLGVHDRHTASDIAHELGMTSDG